MSELRARNVKAKAETRQGEDQGKGSRLNKDIKKVEQASYARSIIGVLSLLAIGFFGVRLYNGTLRSIPETPLASDYAQTLQQNKFGQLDEKVLPSGTGTGGPRLQADVEKREAIKEAFVWSWDAYEKHAWGDDELQPLSQTGTNLTSVGAVGYTIIDSIGTLLVMDLIPEYKRAKQWVQDSLDFDKDAQFNTFETTIRILGGLLSAHYLTSTHSLPEVQADAQLYLDRAIDLGDRLLGAFDSPSGIPWSGINLATREGIPDRDNQGVASLAEAASLQLELKYLSHLTGDYVYWRKAERVSEVIRSQAIYDGIAPIFIAPQNGQFVMSEIRLGSRGDSYYEYLIKQYLQTDRQEPVYRDMYDEAMDGIKKHLVGRTKKSNLMFTQELHPAKHPETGEQTWKVVPKQDHLVCFLGGSFLLGVTEGNRREVDWKKLDPRDKVDMIVGKGIIEGCMRTYLDTPTGLAPEIAMWRLYTDDLSGEEDWYIKPNVNNILIDGRNILRPETVESLMLAYRVTGDEQYREWGWEIFQAFNKHCRVSTGGYAGIEDVQQVPAKQLDRMETFWLGETLKYLYLLFDDSDHIPLDKNIFNTEAHILPVFRSTFLTPFSTS